LHFLIAVRYCHVSGYHMAVVAGVVFFAVRALLALIPGLTVSAPIKKWPHLPACRRHAKSNNNAGQIPLPWLRGGSFQCRRKRFIQID
jgi:hypothetical protein